VATYPPPPETTPAGSGSARGPRANFGQRLVAAIIDVILVAIVGGIVGAVADSTLGSILSAAIGVAYYGWLEGSTSGQP